MRETALPLVAVAVLSTATVSFTVVIAVAVIVTATIGVTGIITVTVMSTVTFAGALPVRCGERGHVTVGCRFASVYRYC